MKKIVLATAVAMLAACGGEQASTPSSDVVSRDMLTEAQREKIAERIRPHSEAVVEGDPVPVSVTTSSPVAGAGEAIYKRVCVACHGSAGEGGVGPMLATQPREDIVSKLTTYREGGVVGAQSALMWSQASNLSDDDIAALADYIDTLTNP